MKTVLFLFSLLLLGVAVLAQDCHLVATADGNTLQICSQDGKVVMTPVVTEETDSETGEVASEPVPSGIAETVSNLAGDADVFYILICGVLVFFMQAGFSMLEAGCVSEKNVQNILFKNLMDAGVGALAFWLVGYAFAYGQPGEADTQNEFIAHTNFALSKMADNEYHSWFFQWAFAATAATIVSGSVAERTQVTAYFMYSFVITAFIYPVVVHWVWSESGWLSAFGSSYMLTGDSAKSSGMIDFAGSGVVHMVGGFSGLCGAYFVGPRRGVFEEIPGVKHVEHNKLIATLGVAILWTGWYGFNCGSTLAINGYSGVAAKVAVTTTLAAASASVTCMLYSKIFGAGTKNLGGGKFDLMQSLNGVLAGLVSITAGCSVVDPWAAFVIGIIGAFVYIGSSALLIKIKVDDPLDACPIHGFCGAWGVLAAGIFASKANLLAAYGIENDAVSSGQQFATQLVGVLAIFAWTMVTASAMFFVLKKTVGLRVTDKEQDQGLDASEHGGTVYDRGPAVTTVPTDSVATMAQTEMVTSGAVNPTADNTVNVHVEA